MKIGILTFHWATNYGAVLQAFALQTVFTQMGHDVEIINYMPKQYDDNLWTFLRYRKFMHYQSYKYNVAKEVKISSFREQNLITTSERYYREKDLSEATRKYDVLISGSDQVMNPSFLVAGEKGGSTAYFLGFQTNCKKIAYAVSFGCTSYPTALTLKVQKLLSTFHAISTREATGKSIVELVEIKNSIVVPDPTILLIGKDYQKFVTQNPNDEYFVYILRHEEYKLNHLKSSTSNKIKFSTNESIENWLSNIYNSKAIITNSFHCVVFSLLFHKNFMVVLNTKENVGMNDRFYTLLGKCGLLDRITTYDECSETLLTREIDWEKVDFGLEELRKIGKHFLESNI